MSLILDALQRGRARTASRPNSTPAQTDAVLQTLGYGRPASPPPRRIRHFVSFAVLGTIVSAAILGAIWLTAHYHAR